MVLIGNDIFVPLSLAVPNAEMTLNARNEIIVIPIQAITNTLHRRQVNLGLRDLIVGVRILRMTTQPLLHMRWHRWLLWLTRTLRLLLLSLSLQALGSLHLG